MKTVVQENMVQSRHLHISQYQVPQSQLAARHPPEDGLKLIRPQLGVASIESEQPGESQCQGVLGEAGQVVV